MASCAFAKEDIEVLTNKILENRVEIIQKLYDEHIEIDPALLYSNYRNQLHPQSIESVGASHGAPNNNDSISLDDFERIYSELDEIDQKLPDLPRPAEFKEPRGLRRFNSRSDITDKTMSSSMTNLTLIKKVTTPVVAPPPPPPELEPTVKLTTADLVEFNALKQQLKAQLDEVKQIKCAEDPFGFAETGRKISDSFDRLQKFFDEIIPLAPNSRRAEIKTEANDGSSVWDMLDSEWIQSLRNLSEVRPTSFQSNFCYSNLRYNLL